jgi:hypothetical protein
LDQLDGGGVQDDRVAAVPSAEGDDERLVLAFGAGAAATCPQCHQPLPLGFVGECGQQPGLADSGVTGNRGDRTAAFRQLLEDIGQSVKFAAADCAAVARLTRDGGEHLESSDATSTVESQSDHAEI